MSPVTWRPRPFLQRHRLGRTHKSDGRQESAAGVSSESKWGGRAEAFFSQAASYLSMEGGSIQGKMELAEALDTTGVV
jgi:hypothetical protein